MDNLFIPLVIVVIIFVNFRKIMKNKKKTLEKKTGSKPETPKGIFSRINQAMEEYAEAAKAEAKAKAPEPAAESVEEWPPKENIEPDGYQAAVEEDIDTNWPPRKKELVVEKRELMEKGRNYENKLRQISEVAKQKKQKVAVSVKGSQPCFNRKTDPAKLRNAIIWSEILAPPVSLKEE